MVEDQQFEIAYTIQKNTWISPILIGVVNATCSNEAIDVVIDREKDFDVNIISIKEFDQLQEEKCRTCPIIHSKPCFSTRL